MKRFIENYRGDEFDLIIIGGGITGAAVAYDAASRGLKVALLEKNDFGWATSAATSKLIHGGMRYLDNLEFGLVRESLRERRILENIAPNFVYPVPFLIPTYKSFKNNKWLIKIGMILYDLLSFDKKWTWDRSKKIPLHSTMSREKVLQEEPNVRPKGLTGATIYYDCQSIFPERLTLAFVKSAVKYGASVANYAKVEEFIYTDGKKIAGVKVRDLLRNRMVEIKGRLTINCCGPWADIILNIAEKGENNQHIRRSEGIHLITKNLVRKNAVGILGKGKHFFLVPWRGHSLIGTTDKEYVGKPDRYEVTGESVRDFLEVINKAFGDGELKPEDIRYVYGGLRPLVDDQTEGTYKKSRKYEIYDNGEDGYNGLITVEGGKYTTSRKLAENALVMIQKKLGRKLPGTITDKVYLQGCEIKDMNSFLAEIKKDHGVFEEKTVEYLGRNYGSESREVLRIAKSDNKYADVLNDDGEILAEVIFAVREEMALTLSDILFRRTGLGTLGHPGRDVLKKIAKTAARELKWSEARMKKEIAEAEKRFVIPR